jgi:hypothetical protein
MADPDGAGLAGAVAVFTLPGLDNQLRLVLFVIPFAVICIAIPALTYIAHKHYRCPACDALPRTHRGVLLDPRECPECGVSLK